MGVYNNDNGNIIPLATNLRTQSTTFENFVTQEELVEGLATKLDLYEVVTPQMFGAKADGVTDDSEAVRQALLASNIVYFPTGTYSMSKQVVLNSNQTIYGDGSDKTIFNFTSNDLTSGQDYGRGRVVTGHSSYKLTDEGGNAIEPVSNITMKGIGLQGSYYTPTSEKVLLLLTHCSNSHFEDVKSVISAEDTSSNTNAMEILINCHDITFRDCQFEHHGANAGLSEIRARYGTDTYNINFYNCVFNKTDGVDEGFAIFGENNSSQSTTYRTGIVHNILMNGCTFDMSSVTQFTYELTTDTTVVANKTYYNFNSTTHLYDKVNPSSYTNPNPMALGWYVRANYPYFYGITVKFGSTSNIKFDDCNFKIKDCQLGVIKRQYTNLDDADIIIDPTIFNNCYFDVSHSNTQCSNNIEGYVFYRESIPTELEKQYLFICDNCIFYHSDVQNYYTMSNAPMVSISNSFINGASETSPLPYLNDGHYFNCDINIRKRTTFKNSNGKLVGCTIYDDNDATSSTVLQALNVQQCTIKLNRAFTIQLTGANATSAVIADNVFNVNTGINSYNLSSYCGIDIHGNIFNDQFILNTLSTSNTPYFILVNNYVKNVATISRNSFTQRYGNSFDKFTIAMQSASLPNASISQLGKIYQYIGDSTSSYTNGYFYKCVSDGAVDPTYSWEELYDFATNTELADGLATKQDVIQYFDVATMKSDTSLEAGRYVQTLCYKGKTISGKMSAVDKGGAVYFIDEDDGSYIDNAGSVIRLDNGNFAILQRTKEMYITTFGVIESSTLAEDMSNNSTRFANAVAYCKQYKCNLIIPATTCWFSQPIVIDNLSFIELRGDGDAELHYMPTTDNIGTDFITINTWTDAIIKNLAFYYIDGGNSSDMGNVLTLGSSATSTRSIMQHCLITGGKNGVVITNNNSYITFNQVRCVGQQVTHGGLVANSAGFVLNDSEYINIIDSSSEGYSNGLYVRGGQYYYITQCDFPKHQGTWDSANSKFIDGYGVLLKPDANNQCRIIHLTQNSFLNDIHAVGLDASNAEIKLITIMDNDIMTPNIAHHEYGNFISFNAPNSYQISRIICRNSCQYYSWNLNNPFITAYPTSGKVYGVEIEDDLDTTPTLGVNISKYNSNYGVNNLRVNTVLESSTAADILNNNGVTYDSSTGAITINAGKFYTYSQFGFNNGNITSITGGNFGEVINIKAVNAFTLSASCCANLTSTLNVKAGQTLRLMNCAMSRPVGGVYRSGWIAEIVNSDYIALSDLKSVAAASSDFADFQSRIAAL